MDNLYLKKQFKILDTQMKVDIAENMRDNNRN